MTAVFIISLREALEASLIISIILGVLKKSKQEDKAKYVWMGLAASTAASILLAAVLLALGTAFEGQLEEAFEGIIMLGAAGVITWVIFWYRSQVNPRESLTKEVDEANRGNSGKAIFMLVFLSVFREGVELVFILAATYITVGAVGTAAGLLGGLAAAALLSLLIFRSLIRLNLGLFFRVTTVLLVFFAAGLIAHGIHELNEVGWIPSIIDHVWDINSVLDEKSGVGEVLKILFGYNGNPSLTEVVGYAGYMLVLGLAFRQKPQMKN